MISLVCVHKIIEQWRRIQQCRRTRQQLLQLDTQQLKDIGLSRSDALEEGRKPWWKN